MYLDICGNSALEKNWRGHKCAWKDKKMRGHSNVTMCKRKINPFLALCDWIHLVQPEGRNRKMSEELLCTYRIHTNIRRDSVLRTRETDAY